MFACGIIAEYNPLHGGHIYQLRDAKARSGCQCAIVVMSGSFVQRGDTAAYDKWQRTRWALAAGADLVLELPAAYALQGADGFAFGGVATLAATGLLGALCFGSETADRAALDACAALEHSPDFHAAVKAQTAAGKSYPAAVQVAAESLLPPYASLLQAPNFTLGVAYKKALDRLCPDAGILMTERKGAAHDAAGLCGAYSSASAFRAALADENRRADALLHLPDFVAADISNELPASLEGLVQALLCKLRCSSPEDLRLLYGVDEGLENLLKKGAEAGSLSDLLAQVKSKRYTLSRLRRTLCAVLLGLTKEDVAAANRAAPYLRVLGLRKEAKPLLSALCRCAVVPVITKKADADGLAPAARRLYELDCLAADITALARSCKTAGRDKTEPLILV